MTDEELKTLAYDIIEGRVMSSRILWAACNNNTELFEKHLPRVFKCKNLSPKEIKFFKDAIRSDLEVFFYSYSANIIDIRLLDLNNLPEFDNTYYLVGPEITKLLNLLTEACKERLM